MDLLKKNLEIIEKQTPELAQLIRQGSSDEFTTEIKTARSNAPTLLIKKENQEIFLHSKFDSQKEADKIAMLIHRPSFDLFTDFYKNLKNVLYSFINRKEVNIATLSRFEELWTRNILRNLKRFATLPGINQLINQETHPVLNTFERHLLKSSAPLRRLSINC